MYEYNKKVRDLLDDNALEMARGFTYTYATCFVSYYNNLDRIETREDLAQALSWYRDDILSMSRYSETPAEEYVACIVDDTFALIDEPIAEAEIWKAIEKTRRKNVVLEDVHAFWHKTMMNIIDSDFFSSTGEFEDDYQYNYHVAIGVIKGLGDGLEAISKKDLHKAVEDFIAESLTIADESNLFIYSTMQDVCEKIDKALVVNEVWKAVQRTKKGGAQ